MQHNATNELRDLLSRFLCCFVILFILSLPFPYYIVPDIGKWVSLVWRPLVDFAAVHLFKVSPPYTLDVLSDSTGMYIQALLLIPVSITAALIWKISQKRKSDLVAYYFRSFCAYYLSLQLLKYGFDKVFKYQFYLPEPNTLHTNLGELSRDILYWSTIGSSYSYSVFLGIAEIIPAVLLLFQRTRFIGALVAFFVMLNVVMINFSFDISVKLYSGFLLLLILIVAAPGIQKIYIAYREDKWKKEVSDYPFRNNHKHFYLLLKISIVATILTESLWGYVQSGIYNDDAAQRPYLHGAWKVKEHIQNKDTLTCTDDRFIKNLFVHRKGYLIVQNVNGQMKDYKLTVSGTYFILTDYDNTELRFNYSENQHTLYLENEVMNIKAEKTDLSKLPLMQNDFHWTIDSY